ncbi:MAG: ATP-binding protein [Thermoleophilaceae bacterium]
MPLNPGWTIRLRELFGAEMPQLTEESLHGLIEGQVREDDDLDFKRESYGSSDGQKRALAADIAAMANHRGGVIVIGVREENEIAVELTAVEAIDGEEGRLRQIGAGGITPHVEFHVKVIPCEADRGRAYYLLVVPPSPLRPHAVRKDIDLRYPRRDGSHTRWLAEAEVASMYRDRFRMVEDHLARIESVADDGLTRVDLREDWAYLAVALVPTTPGSMSIGEARIRQLEEWAVDRSGTFAWHGFYGSRPNGRAGIRRIRLGALVNREPPIANYSELHTDGSGMCCEQVGLAVPRQDENDDPSVIQISETALLWVLARSLRLIGRHAVENAGAWGDAIVIARLFGRDKQLTYPISSGLFQQPWNHEAITDQVVGRHTIPLASLTGSDQELLASTRVVGADLFNAFGAPEVAQIDEHGRIRIRDFHGQSQTQIAQFAEARGVEVTDDTVRNS